MNNLDKYNKIIELYRRDERIRDFILSFFKSRRATNSNVTSVRCCSFQDKTRGIHFRYGWNEQKALTGINIENFWRRIKTAEGMAMFFYGYIFDEYVTDPGYYHWEYVRDDNGNIETYSTGKKKIRILHDYYIIGGSIVFEIDAPGIENGGSDGSDKVDIFDKKYYPLFMWVKKRIEQKLDMLGTRYNCLFSGNGIYIIVESTFFSELENMNLTKFRKTKQNMFEKIQPFVVSRTSNVPVIDLRDIGWATYYKVPFTFHETRNRMVIPISKGYINREWLDKATNMANGYVTSEANITDILNRCGWKFDIW